MTPPPGGTDTLTIRLPSALKEVVDRTAQAKGITTTALVRQALEETLTPERRIYQHPALTPAFDDFWKSLNGISQVIVILAITDKGQRHFFEGPPEYNLANGAIVAIERREGRPWIIPKCEIVAWFKHDAPALRSELAMSLVEQGWIAHPWDYR